MKYVLMLVGLAATALAVLGAILPGLPTTPFLLVALWAFAKSNARLHAWLKRLPILQTALREAERFEQQGTMRLSVKLFAFSMSWSSVALTAFVLAPGQPVFIGLVFAAAVLGTLVVIFVPTDPGN